MNSSRNPNPSQDELLAELEELRFETHDLLFGSIRNRWIADWKPRLADLIDSADEGHVARALVWQQLAQLDRVVGKLPTAALSRMLDELWTSNHVRAVWDLDADLNTMRLVEVGLYASKSVACSARETVGLRSFVLNWDAHLSIQYELRPHQARFIVSGGAWVEPQYDCYEPEIIPIQSIDSIDAPDGRDLGTFPALSQALFDFLLARLRHSNPGFVPTTVSSNTHSASERRYAPGEFALLCLIERRLLELETLLTDANRNEPPMNARRGILWTEFFGHSTGGHHTVYLKAFKDGTSDLSTGPMTWTLDVNKHYPEHASAGKRSELPLNVEITLFHDKQGTCAISTRPPYMPPFLTDARTWNRRLIALPTISSSIRQGLLPRLAASTITSYAIDLPSSLRYELLKTGPEIGTPTSSGPSPDPVGFVDFDDVPF